MSDHARYLDILNLLKGARDKLRDAVEVAEELEAPRERPIVSGGTIIGHYTLQDSIEEALHDIGSVINEAETEVWTK